MVVRANQIFHNRPDLYGLTLHGAMNEGILAQSMVALLKQDY
jgi:hypothetical protein